MGNRHNFESIVQNKKFFDVVSTNQKNFESIINNRHNFEVIVSEGFSSGEFWSITFVQDSKLELEPNLLKDFQLEIASSFSSIYAPTLIQYMHVEFSMSGSVEMNVGLTSDILSLEFVSATNFEGVLSQNIKIYNVEETIEIHKMETEPSYRHYFLLNNYSGSTLDELDSMLLQDMDYELV